MCKDIFRVFQTDVKIFCARVEIGSPTFGKIVGITWPTLIARFMVRDFFHLNKSGYWYEG